MSSATKRHRPAQPTRDLSIDQISIVIEEIEGAIDADEHRISVAEQAFQTKQPFTSRALVHKDSDEKTADTNDNEIS